MTIDELRELFLDFPGVQEAPSYGTPGFRLRKRAAQPRVFYLTPHYEGKRIAGLLRQSCARRHLCRDERNLNTMALSLEQPDHTPIVERVEGVEPLPERKSPKRQPMWLSMATSLSPLVTSLLVSPLHGLLSRKLMLVTVKGRHSETVYTFPVAYQEVDALVIALVPEARTRTWWRNFIEPRYASITIRGARTSAQGFVPVPGSEDFNLAAEQILGRSPLARRLYGVKLDAMRQLGAIGAHKLAQNARLVIFDRAPALDRVAPRPEAAGQVAGASAEREVPPSDGAELRVAELIEPVLAELTVDARPAALALAERVAAERYRMWAKEISEPAIQTVLAECAVREDDIASRVEGAVPGALSIQESIVCKHPDLAAEFLAVFDGMPLTRQFAFQAKIQHAMADTWRILAETAPAHVRSILLECSYLEEKSASALEGLIQPDGR